MSTQEDDGNRSQPFTVFSARLHPRPYFTFMGRAGLHIIHAGNLRLSEIKVAELPYPIWCALQFRLQRLTPEELQLASSLPSPEAPHTAKLLMKSSFPTHKDTPPGLR